MSQVPELSRSLQFRHCVHQGPTNGDVTSIVAAIRGEACILKPSPRAVDAVVVFQKVGHVLGAKRLAELWRVYRSDGRLESCDPRSFPPFLARQDVGQEYLALADLARLDLGLFLAGLDDREPSIGACCLPIELIAGHPDLMLRLQSTFRYLGLAYPVHEWRIGQDELPSVVAPQPIFLRLSPDRTGSLVGIRHDLLSPARFVFESGLARGRTLVAATKLAALQDPLFDGAAGVAALIQEGAVADVVLHTKP